MTETSLLRVPKKFFHDERIRVYADWRSAIVRELFQNSIDAGAGRIAMDLAVVPAETAFGRRKDDDGQAHAVRVVFQDDGSGMTPDVIDNVFFEIGRSTKTDGSQTGGFGRARLALAFGSDRYLFVTNGRFVEGDGAEYRHVDIDQAMAELSVLARSDDEVVAATASRKIEFVERYRGTKGTVFELDITRHAGRRDAERDAERIQDALNSFVPRSNFRADINVNGESFPTFAESPAKKGSSRNLTTRVKAEDLKPEWLANPLAPVELHEDGEATIRFGTIARVTQENEKKAHACHGRVLIRSNGVYMHEDYVSGPSLKEAGFIVEIDPHIARDVLSASRDSLVAPFRDELQQFINALSIDPNRAMSDSKVRIERVAGAKGVRVSERKPKLSAEQMEEVLRQVATGTVTAASASTSRAQEDERRHVLTHGQTWSGMIEKRLFGRVPVDMASRFFTSLADEGDSNNLIATLLREATSQTETRTFLRDVADRGVDVAFNDDRHHAVLSEIENRLYRVYASFLDAERRHASIQRQDLGDVVIVQRNLHSAYADESGLPADTAAAYQRASRAGLKKLSPDNWDISTGKGAHPRKLLAAWTVAVEFFVDALAEKTGGKFTWTTGWIVEPPTMDYAAYEAPGSWGDRRETTTSAVHYPLPDEVHAILLAPIDYKTGKLRYSVSDPADRETLIVTAAHEVAHIVANQHDTSFAYAFTDLMLALTPQARRDLNRSIDTAVKAVDLLHAQGRSMVEHRGEGEGPRPIERLLGLSPASPGSTSEFDPEAESLGEHDDPSWRLAASRS